MKKFSILFLLVFAAGCGGNGIVVKKFDPSHVLHCKELRNLKNVTDLKEYAGYLDKGDTFPLMLSIDDDIIGVKQKSIDIAIKQKLYFMVKMPDDPTKEELRIIEQFDWDSLGEAEQKKFVERYMLYVSRDALHWAPIYDGKALKQVMGIKGDRFSFGIGMTTEDGVKSVLTVKTEG
jgi:hypothetical protein